MASSRGGSKMSWLWHDDVELAKKDDDLKLPGHPRQAGPWQPARVPRRTIFVRRICLAVVILALVSIIYRTLASSTTASTADQYTGRLPPNLVQPPRSNPYPPSRAPPKSQTSKSEAQKKEEKEQRRDYAGKLRFPELGSTLQAIAATGGSATSNRNVLFVAASLQSLATLLPLACQMAEDRQSYVHFAFMSRSELSIQDILKINGFDSSCPLILHDARPDYPARSTEQRMSVASARALYHINLFMHPQAVFVDSTSQEEPYLLSGLRDQARSIKAEFIELPGMPELGLSWLTRLDSAALAAWNKIHIDILIHAPAHGTGNLMRLLRSLSRADLRAVGFPQLTIELPPTIDEPLQKFLDVYQWPPQSPVSTSRLNMLSLRRRIPRQKLTEEEASARFLESYWPGRSSSHVLVLSPNTEITPQFFNFVKYSVLHHSYSNLATAAEWKPKMMGISFSTPATLLDASQVLQIPGVSGDESEDIDTSFVWQAPTSEAVLFPSEKWMELHGFVSQMLDRRRDSSVTSTILSTKEISKKYPSWLEYVLQLSRLRGYYTVYPGKGTESTIMGVHDDLYEMPEEYEDETLSGEKSEDGLVDRTGSAFDPNTIVSMLETLPRDGVLPAIQNLPLLSWDGKSISLETLNEQAAEYTRQFRREVGQCKDTESKAPAPDALARDLFCTTKEHA